MIMERTIQVVTSLNNKSKRQEVLTNQFIDMLWYSLDHPPQLYMGDEFKYRQPDGSNNVGKTLRNPLLLTHVEPAYAEARRGQNAVLAHLQAWCHEPWRLAGPGGCVRSSHGKRRVSQESE